MFRDVDLLKRIQNKDLVFQTHVRIKRDEEYIWTKLAFVLIPTEDEKYIVQLFNHPLINKNANINLVKSLNSNIFEMITYEKGVGFTKACGTGAASSAFVLHNEYQMNNELIAVCPGGILKVDILDEIILTGESQFIESYDEEL